MTTRNKIPVNYVEKLNQLPFVEKATEWTVTFTPEFKIAACEAYSNGKSIREIFKESGLDVDILGDKRLHNFRNRICELKRSNREFDDRRKSNCRRESKSTEAQLAKKVRQLELQNEYLKQENEFLKKIQLLEKTCAEKAKYSK